jgi:hypothetical protein
MRPRLLVAVLVALLVPVAVMVIMATGLIGPGTWSSPVGAAPAPGGHTKPGNGPCVVVISHWSTQEYPEGPIGNRPAPASRGDISVSIPPTVFIRVEGGLMVVTTNTGTPPASQDGFWVLEGHTAAPASASVRAEVLAGCNPWRQR